MANGRIIGASVWVTSRLHKPRIETLVLGVDDVHSIVLLPDGSLEVSIIVLEFAAKELMECTFNYPKHDVIFVSREGGVAHANDPR